jgi:hypothetical protein
MISIAATTTATVAIPMADSTSSIVTIAVLLRINMTPAASG